jgi:transposase-like protein
VISLFAFPAEMRKIIYTTNAIESPRNKGHFPNDQAAIRIQNTDLLAC